MRYIYIQSNLLNDENLILASRPHWIIYFPAFVAAVIGLAFLEYGSNLMLRTPIYSLQIYQWIALIMLAWAVLLFLRAYTTYRTSEYGVTDKRILMKTGFIQRNSLEIFLDKIEGVLVDQTIPGRVFNYGTIIVLGTGGTRDPFFNVRDPLNFRRTVQQQIDRSRAHA